SHTHAAIRITCILARIYSVLIQASSTSQQPHLANPVNKLISLRVGLVRGEWLLARRAAARIARCSATAKRSCSGYHPNNGLRTKLSRECPYVAPCLPLVCFAILTPARAQSCWNSLH